MGHPGRFGQASEISLPSGAGLHCSVQCTWDTPRQACSPLLSNPSPPGSGGSDSPDQWPSVTSGGLLWSGTQVRRTRQQGSSSALFLRCELLSNPDPVKFQAHVQGNVGVQLPLLLPGQQLRLPPRSALHSLLEGRGLLRLKAGANPTSALASTLRRRRGATSQVAAVAESFGRMPQEACYLLCCAVRPRRSNGGLAWGTLFCGPSKEVYYAANSQGTSTPELDPPQAPSSRLAARGN